MSLLIHAPQFSQAEAETLALEFYGIKASAALLASERDQNFVLRVAGEKRYVLKIANALEDQAFLEAQNAALEHLKDLSICPRVLGNKEGQVISRVSANNRTYLLRLLSFLPGTPLAQQTWVSEALIYDLGKRLGNLDYLLQSFDHPALHRDFHWDLAQAPKVIARYGELIQEAKLSEQLRLLTERFESYAQPFVAELRKSIIHNDANDYNILVATKGGTFQQSISGLIDYGDMIYSHTINDLAIAIAYAILAKPRPLETALPLIRGYHQENPLSETELKVLFPLIGLRLSASVAIAAQQQTQRPDDTYLAISQAPIRQTLPLLLELHPNFVEACFREACGFTALPKTRLLESYLAHCPVKTLLPAPLYQQEPLLIDLSIASPDLPYDSRIDKDSSEPERVFELLQKQRRSLGIGRYNEPRLIYTAPEFAVEDHPFSERRSVHLGLDLFAEAGTSVYAPLEGKVFAVAANPLPLDYGHVLILEHQTDAAIPFYTLYGHLKASVLDLEPGQAVNAGTEIAQIGDWHENGGWPPHLHFQVISDLLSLGTDFPAVFKASEVALWQAFCLNPNLICRLPEALTNYHAHSKEKTLELRKKRLGQNLSIGYQKPLKMLRGRAQYLFDETGRRYLDAYNNVPHVGHCHPRVVEAARQQLGILNTNTRYLYDGLAAYAEKLCATLGEPLNVCYFVNSGSEANELALRLSRAYTGCKDILVLEGAYHGHTTSLIDLSPYKHAGPGGEGAPDWVHSVPVADVYRGVYKANDPNAGQHYAEFVREKLSELASRASFIAETCPSVGGQIIFPENYLLETYKHIRAAGGLCIADEVQTGYGRTGSHFYAFEAQKVVPDIVVLGKPIGNGHPIAALITTAAIAEAFNNGMEFFSTFGGNTVSCHIGMAVLDVVKEEGLQAHALNVGNYLLEHLRALKDRYPLIGDVRGSGLFLGVELVKDHENLTPATAEANFLVNRMREAGILLGTDGPLHNVLKIRPPMPFTKEDAQVLLVTLEKLLARHFPA